MGPKSVPDRAFSLMVLLIAVIPFRVVRTLQRRSICTLERCLVCVEPGRNFTMAVGPVRAIHGLQSAASVR